MFKTVTVTLFEPTQTGTDDFGVPIYSETAVNVSGVLVTPSSQAEILTDLQLYGRRSVYELSLPKGDTHEWEDRRVSFFGETFHTIGSTYEWIEGNVPLKWNRKVKVERIE